MKLWVSIHSMTDGGDSILGIYENKEGAIKRETDYRKNNSLGDWERLHIEEFDLNIDYKGGWELMSSDNSCQTIIDREILKEHNHNMAVKHRNGNFFTPCVALAQLQVFLCDGAIPWDVYLSGYELLLNYDSSDGTKTEAVDQSIISKCDRCGKPTLYGELYPLLNCEAEIVKQLCKECHVKDCELYSIE